ncbi:methyl-accepting chemotaxis protein [Pseudomarimonas salicorniae]|uniref:methyl-accepting chemotaxis protein n=1 Tax=Pseudomarimonas salicorniae TaxID=2933270 RepID=UPI00249F131B|nr:methyl-accepting chemotaxis protein [Lysobacter sp. CAU 1642]
MGLRSIAARTALILALVAALCFAGAAWLILQKASAEQQETALRELEQLARAEAAKVRGMATEPLVMVRGLAEATLQMIEQEVPSRDQASGLVRRYAVSDPGTLGYWLEFERNGFDGRDDELARDWNAPPDDSEAPADDAGMPAFPAGEPSGDEMDAYVAGLSPGEQVTTDSGRLSIYWVLDDNGEPSLEHSVGSEGDKDLEGEDYYVAARDRGAEMMFEPYVYPVDGEDVLMTSLMMPLLRNGQHIGVAGADITLDRIQSELAAVSPYGNGVVRLLSPSGMVLAAPESQLLGQAWPQDLAAVQAELARGGVVRTREDDAAVGQEVFRVYVPVKVGRGSDVFMLAVSAPVDAVMAGVAEVRNRVALVAVASVIVLAVVLAVLLNRLVGRPLQGVVTAVNAVAQGKLDYPIAARGQDEVGQVGDALRGMQRDLRERIESERAIAAQNLRVRIALDNAGTAMLIADASGRIAYANPAFRGLLREHGAALAEALPSLDPSAIEGAALEVLQRPGERSLIDIAEVVRSQREFGASVFEQTAAPVRSAEGEKLGVVLEWRDRSQEIAVEAEVAGVIEAAAAGDLSRRIGVAGKQGFFRRLAEGVDGMLDANEQSISEVQRVLAALAEGDLTQRITADFGGVFGQMRDDTNLTAERLTDIMAKVREAVDAINTAAREISAGNQDLSARSEQQAASLEETAAAMEQLTSTVKNNAESSRQARQLAVGAADVASRGGAVVHQVVEQMDGITRASKQIGDIIGVIDGIAFQTNILALNAAVEAARAGEQGRGFAVVASEVRSLAQRSAEAAKQIKGLISQSGQRVDQGAALVSEAGATMTEIVEAVRRVNDLMGEIASASDEQATGIEQVNHTITHMDGVTQQNVALVEEATAAAGSLEEQAGKLADAVAVFRLR